MAKVAITSAGIQIFDGTQTRNNIVSIGSNPLRMCIGVVGGRVFDDFIPLPSGAVIIIPPLLRVTFYSSVGSDGVIHSEDFGA